MGICNRIAVDDWTSVASTTLDPQNLPPTLAMAAALNMNRPSVTAPGGAHMATLEAFRSEHREQQLAFQMSADLTRLYTAQPTCEAPPHVLFPQVLRIVQRYLEDKVIARAPAVRLDAFLSPYYGWIIERLLAAIKPDTAAGEAPEVPDVDEDRPLRTADISFFTPRPVAEAARTHLNLVVSDTISWEQSAGYQLDHHPAIRSFVKNSGLSFAVTYLHNGELSEYIPDFIARLECEKERYLIAELKGQDWRATAEIKAQAGLRWCAAINATGRYGRWDYFLAYKVSELVSYIDSIKK